MKGWPQTTYLVYIPASDDLHIGLVSRVFHRFAEHGVVNQFVKVALEIALCFLPEFGNPGPPLVSTLCLHFLSFSLFGLLWA